MFELNASVTFFIYFDYAQFYVTEFLHIEKRYSRYPFICIKVENYLYDIFCNHAIKNKLLLRKQYS